MCFLKLHILVVKIIGTQTDTYETYHNNIYQNGITYQQVRMLTLLQNRHQQLFRIKKSKNFN
jgi:hypothetical protein